MLWSYRSCGTTWRTLESLAAGYEVLSLHLPPCFLFPFANVACKTISVYSDDGGQSVVQDIEVLPAETFLNPKMSACPYMKHVFYRELSYRKTFCMTLFRTKTGPVIASMYCITHMRQGAQNLVTTRARDATVSRNIHDMYTWDTLIPLRQALPYYLELQVSSSRANIKKRPPTKLLTFTVRRYKKGEMLYLMCNSYYNMPPFWVQHTTQTQILDTHDDTMASSTRLDHLTPCPQVDTYISDLFTRTNPKLCW